MKEKYWVQVGFRYLQNNQAADECSSTESEHHYLRLAKLLHKNIQAHQLDQIALSRMLALNLQRFL